MTQTVNAPQEATACKVNGANAESRTYSPRVDIVEGKDGYTISFDAPGADANAIDVQYEDGLLTVHATAPARQGSDVTFVRREYAVGDYHRSLRIGAKVDVSKITADYSNGVLTLTLPKLEAVKPRKITVQAK